MSQWKLSANNSLTGISAGQSSTNGAVSWVASSLHQGSGNLNELANNAAISNCIYTNAYSFQPGLLKEGTGTQNLLVTQLPLTPGGYANISGDSRKAPGGPGWILRRAFTGPILTANVTANNTTLIANGETVTVSNGAVNAVFQLQTNATGNLIFGTAGSLALINGGLFCNATSANGAVAFNREKHIANVTVTGTANTTTGGGFGASNTYTMTISNTGNSFAVGVGSNGFATITSNSANGITNTQLTVTWTGNTNPACNYWGLFSNNQTNTVLSVTFSNSSCTSVNTLGMTFVANLASSTGGGITILTLGGRAGRVQYETLVSTRFIANGQLANSVPFPS